MEGKQEINGSFLAGNPAKRCWRSARVVLLSAASAVVLLSACSTTATIPSSTQTPDGRDANRLFVVDCLLPGQLRRLGRNMSFMTPRRPVKVSVSECEIRGGEYVAYDRANFATSLKIWLPKAESGDPEAQTYVGEIFEKGLGQTADAEVAAAWYLKAAEQGYSRAQINLGYLYESGLGVEQDLTKAMNLYRQAAGFADGNLEYITSVEIASRQQQAAAIPLLNAELDQVNANLVAERQAFATLQADYQQLEQQAQTARTQLSGIGSPALVGAAANDLAKKQVGLLLTDIDQLKSQLSSSEKTGTELLAQLEAQQQETAELRGQLTVSNAELNETQDRLTTLNAEINSLQLANLQENDPAEASQRQQQLEQSLALKDQLSADVKRLKADMSQQTRQMVSQLSVAEAKEKSLTLDLDKTRQSVTTLQQALQSKDDTYRQQLKAMNVAQDDLQSRLSEQQDVIKELEDRLVQKQRSIDTEQTSKAAVNSSVGELQAELVEERGQLLQIAEEKSAGEQGSIEELARLETVLQAKQGIVADQREKIGQLERRVSNAQAAQLGPAIEQYTPSLQAVGPTIEIIDPPLTYNKGVFGLQVSPASDTVEVTGRISSVDELLSFRIDGDEPAVNEHGVFQHPASVDVSSSMKLTAIDVAGKRVAMEIMLKRMESSDEGGFADHSIDVDVSQIDFGSYHALIIGNSQYQDMQAVETAANDATALARVLEERYEFSTELLIDADRYDIMAAMNRKRDELGRQDNLLVYFAGHGASGDGKGYWMPIDADPNDKRTWISNAAVTGLVDSMSAKHVMLLADSVFSGTLSRASLIRVGTSMAPDERLQAYELASSAKARTVLSAGTSDPVPGPDSAGHSFFTHAVLDGLKNNSSRVTMAHDLFVQVREQLASTSIDQDRLQYAPLKFAGHENGEFMFVSADNQNAANRHHDQ